ncbi:hypothetical protein [Neorhodopirellula lusitana]|uniref:hypothetical protein n=1 Tax=Neorhodopirellula lusitana TaxID=445327 RepID=UPI0024B7E0E1|nr:hypothetical protein [Neorhodopirellula lusitana]
MSPNALRSVMLGTDRGAFGHNKEDGGVVVRRQMVAAIALVDSKTFWLGRPKQPTAQGAGSLPTINPAWPTIRR